MILMGYYFFIMVDLLQIHQPPLKIDQIYKIWCLACVHGHTLDKPECNNTTKYIIKLQQIKDLEYPNNEQIYEGKPIFFYFSF